MVGWGRTKQLSFAYLFLTFLLLITIARNRLNDKSYIELCEQILKFLYFFLILDMESAHFPAPIIIPELDLD